MGASRRVLKNTVFMAINKISLPLFSFLLLVYIAKIRTPEMLGQYSLVTAFFIILQVLPLLGLAPLFVREVARNPRERDSYITGLGLITFVSSLVFNLLFACAVFFLRYPPEVSAALFFVGLAVFPGSWAFICELTFVAFEKMKYTAFITFGENFLRMFFSIMLLKRGYGIKELFLLAMGFKVFSFAAYLFFLNKELGAFRITFKHEVFKELLSQIKIFLPGALLFLVFSRADHLFLSKMDTFQDLGYYSAAYRITEASTIVLSAFIIAIVPLLSRSFTDSREYFIRVSQKGIKYAMLIVFPLAAYLYFGADRFISLLYKSAYRPSAVVLKILCLYLLFYLFDQMFSIILVTANRQRDDLKAAFLGAFSYLFLLYFLIRNLSISGAAWATVIAAFIQVGTRYFFIRNKIGRLRLLETGFKPLFATFLLAVVFFYLSPHNIMLGVFASGIAYLALVFFCGIISFKEVNLLYAKR